MTVLSPFHFAWCVEALNETPEALAATPAAEAAARAQEHLLDDELRRLVSLRERNIAGWEAKSGRIDQLKALLSPGAKVKRRAQWAVLLRRD